MDENKKGFFSGKSQRNPKTSAGLRAVAGAYLMYLAYQIFEGIQKGESSGPFMIIAVIVFGVCGALFLFLGVRDLMGSREIRDINEIYGESEDEEEEEDEISEEKEVSSETNAETKLSIADRAKLTDRIQEKDIEE